MRRMLLLALAVGCAQPAPPPTPAPTVPGPAAAVTPPPPMDPQRLRIIGTNDFHGALMPRADETEAMRGGAANLATAIRNAERECRLPECATLIVDGGDMFQGTPAS